MADKTEIAWCDSTFNPWIGCTKVGPGCDNCYAEADFGQRKKRAVWGAGEPRSRTSVANWKQPILWNKQPFCECQNCGWRGDQRDTRTLDEPGQEGNWCPSCGNERVHVARRRVFCSSLADVFDNEVPERWRADLFELIAKTPNLDWLLLTKRIGNASRMIAEAAAATEFKNDGIESWTTSKPWPNVWIGASICNQTEADRDIQKLLSVPAVVRFVSMEPLLEAVNLHGFMPFSITHGMTIPENSHAVFGGLDWVVVGGESGQNARPMHPNWASSLRDQCAEAGVPFLFKQWGEWVPRSSCYHTFEDGTSCCDIDPGATKWPCIKLNENGGDGHRLEDEDGGDSAYMQRVGKKFAGRLLDGVQHDGYPEVKP